MVRVMVTEDGEERETLDIARFDPDGYIQLSFAWDIPERPTRYREIMLPNNKVRDVMMAIASESGSVCILVTPNQRDRIAALLRAIETTFLPSAYYLSEPRLDLAGCVKELRDILGVTRER